MTSKDLDPNEVQFQDPYMALNPTRADSVERIIYKDTYGSVADMSHGATCKEYNAVYTPNECSINVS